MNIFRQIIGLLIFIINHVCYLLISEKTYTTGAQIAFGLIGCIILLVAYYDYRLNYKKVAKFRISPFTLIILNIAMWALDEYYLLAIINLILFVVFLAWERREGNEKGLVKE